MKYFPKIKDWILALLKIRTVGVRALVLKGDSVLLVKHTYQPLWYTVGGAVERGESPLQAIVRELREEVGALLDKAPKLSSVYYSRNQNRDDYVIFYLVNSYQFEESNSPEILDKQWFPLHQLPEDVSPATQRRIDEYLGKIPLSDTW